MKVAIEFDDSLKTETSTTVSWSTIFKGIDVVLDGVNWDLPELGSLDKHFWIVDSLGTTCDFFTSHEEIVGVSIVRVSWVQHSVEWSNGSWVTVEHIEISVVFLLHKFTESFLRKSR